MKFIHTLLTGLILCSVFACKPEATPTKETTIEVPAADETTTNEKNPNLAANMSWTFLTDQLFHHRVTVERGNVDENERKGHWVDFHENGKYDYGVWGDKTLEGTWSYDDNTKVLEMKPMGDAKPSEWRLKHMEDNLIMLGTATYGNNTQQVQWIRHEQRPDKNAKPVDEQEDQ